jgi:DNA ligase-1
MHEFPTLYKKTALGKVQMWRVWVEPSGGEADLCIEHGLVDGKKQTTRERIAQGKNLGKANETSPSDQAVAEAQSRWNKQHDRKGYGLDPTGEESAAKRAAMPMLAKKWSEMQGKIEWSSAFGQPKLDGYRMLVTNTGSGLVMVSRESKPITTLDHIAEVLLDVMGPGVTLDGELYVHGKILQDIGSLIKRKQEDTIRVEYHIYDAMLNAPFDERRIFVRTLLGKEGRGPVKRVPTSKVHSEEDLMEYEAACVDGGYEGAMLRHGTDPYHAGKRSKSLVKVKRFDDTEFKIIDVKQGRGTHEGMAIFICETSDGVVFDVTAPGTHEQKRACWDCREDMIGRLLTVKHKGYTAEKKPWHPHAKCFKETL